MQREMSKPLACESVLNPTVVIAINGTKITGLDALSTYLEENTLPDQIIEVTVVREKQTISVKVTLGTRP